MKTTLLEPKQLEPANQGLIYQAHCPDQLYPGQLLRHHDQLLELIKTESFNGGYRLTLYSPLPLTSEQTVAVIGKPIDWQPTDPLTLFCEGIGNFTALHWILSQRKQYETSFSKCIDSVIFSEVSEFKFRPTPSTIMTPEYPSEMIAAMPLLDDLGIISRLVCQRFQPGCFEGTLVEMVEAMPEQPASWAVIARLETIQRLTERLGQPSFAITTETLLYSEE